jgi:hypothetical protein
MYVRGRPKCSKIADVATMTATAMVARLLAKTLPVSLPTRRTRSAPQ